MLVKCFFSSPSRKGTQRSCTQMGKRTGLDEALVHLVFPRHSGHTETRGAGPHHTAGTAMPTASPGSYLGSHSTVTIHWNSYRSKALGRRRWSPPKALPESCFPIRLCTSRNVVLGSVRSHERMVFLHVSSSTTQRCKHPATLSVLLW